MSSVYDILRRSAFLYRWICLLSVCLFVCLFVCVYLSRRPATQQSGNPRARQAGSNASSMWKFYTGDDSPGIKMCVEREREGGREGGD